MYTVHRKKKKHSTLCRLLALYSSLYFTTSGHWGEEYRSLYRGLCYIGGSLNRGSPVFDEGRASFWTQHSQYWSQIKSQETQNVSYFSLLTRWYVFFLNCKSLFDELFYAVFSKKLPISSLSISWK